MATENVTTADLTRLESDFTKRFDGLDTVMLQLEEKVDARMDTLENKVDGLVTDVAEIKDILRNGASPGHP